MLYMARRIVSVVFAMFLVSCSAAEVHKTAEFCQALTPVVRALAECAR